MFQKIAFLFLSILVSRQASGASELDSSDRPVSDKWAFVVGISKFQSPDCRTLTYSAKDASDFRDFLVKKAHFAPDHVKLLINEDATRERIISELGQKWLPHKTISDDLVVIFFSTHGSSADNDQIGGLNYLVAYNTDPNELLATGIPFQDITNLIKSRINAKRILLILDACHSGTAVPGGAKGLLRTSNFDANELAQGTGQLVICSSEPSQVSWESKRYPNSVFTHHLIEALSAKGEQTRLVDAFEESRRNVAVEVAADRGQSQSPVMKMYWQGSSLQLLTPPAEPRQADADSFLSKPISEPKPRQPDNIDAGPTISRIPVPKAKVSLPGRLCVLPFSFPLKADVEGLGFRASQMDTVPLRTLVADRLHAVFADRVVYLPKLEQPLRFSNLGAEAPSTWVEIGALTQSKYLLCGSVDEVYFRGKVMTGNDYRLVCSVRIISAETGEVIWEEKGITYKKTSWTTDQLIGTVNYFNKKMIPEMSKIIAEKAQVVLKELNW